jgi:hypothetical protein
MHVGIKRAADGTNSDTTALCRQGVTSKGPR